MSEWRSTTLGELAAPEKSAMSTGPFGSAVSAKEFRSSGVPMIRGSNLSEQVGCRIIDRDLVFVDESLASKFSRSLVKRGDLVFTSWGTIGQIGLIDDRSAYDCYLVSNKQMKMTPDPTRVDARFLYYYLHQPSAQAELRARSIGSTIPGFNLGQLKSLPVAIPGIPEQRAVAEVLGALDDKIAANTKLVAVHAKLSQTLYSTLAGSATQRVHLSEAVTTQYGLTASASDQDGPRFLRVMDINKQPWIDWSNVPGFTTDQNDLSKYLLSAGDIVVARMADPGKAAYIDAGTPPAAFASYLVRLQALNPAHSLFIYHFLCSEVYRNYAEGAMQGSVQKNMNAKVIVNTALNLPEIGLLQKFNEEVGTLRASMHATLTESRALSATRDTILPQLMSGKLRVKDAERAVAGVV